jgi:hypothetical protein
MTMSPDPSYDEVCMRLSNQISIANPSFEYRVLTSMALAQRNELYRATSEILVRIEKSVWRAEIPVSFEMARREPEKIARYVVDAGKYLRDRQGLTAPTPPPDRQSRC